MSEVRHEDLINILRGENEMNEIGHIYYREDFKAPSLTLAPFEAQHPEAYYRKHAKMYGSLANWWCGKSSAESVKCEIQFMDRYNLVASNTSTDKALRSIGDAKPGSDYMYPPRAWNNWKRRPVHIFRNCLWTWEKIWNSGPWATGWRMVHNWAWLPGCTRIRWSMS